jgi:hypothetical protein
LKLCELVRNASFEVSTGLEANQHQLHRTDFREIVHAAIVGGVGASVITPNG